MSNINKKSTPDQMRVFLRRMRGKDVIVNEEVITKKYMEVRDMLKITRKLNEDVSAEDAEDNELKKSPNKVTIFDQKIEEDKFLNIFKDMESDVNVKFLELEVTDNLVFWGGTIDGIIQFTYAVTPYEDKNNVLFNYLEDFTPDNPQNTEIVKRVEDYYNTFAKYWQNNIIQK
jgi:hypothetical protein